MSLSYKFIYIIFAFLLGFLILELATRLLVPGGNNEPVVPTSVGQFDEMLGWSLKPGARDVSSRTGYKIEYEINSKGLRDDEIPYEKPEGVFRIVLIGDSRTFGFGVPEEKHFARVLEGYFSNVDVINLGVAGYGVDQELLALRYEGWRYQPDLVMAYVAHYSSHRHMHTERFGQQKPKFDLVDGKLLLTNSPVEDRRSILSLKLRPINNWLLVHSRVYDIVRTAVKNARRSKGAAVGGRRGDWKDSEKAEYTQRMRALAEAIVFSMDKESTENGAQFVLVTGLSFLHDAALANGLLSVNVVDALSNQYFPLSKELAHVNEAGNGVLAWEIARFLRAHSLVPLKHVQQ